MRGTKRCIDDHAKILIASVCALVLIAGTGRSQSRSIADLKVTPRSLTWPDATVGTTSSSLMVSLTNPNRHPIRIAGMTSTDPDFIVGQQCVRKLEARGTCTFSVTFAPVMQGPHGGAVVLTNKAGHRRQVENLSGTGVPDVAMCTSAFNSAELLCYNPPYTNESKPVLSIGGVLWPAMIRFDRQGNLWVGDSGANEPGHNRIVRLPPPYTNGPDLTFSNGLNHPAAMAFGSAGQVFIMDASNSRIMEYDKNGNVVAIVGDQEPSPEGYPTCFGSDPNVLSLSVVPAMPTNLCNPAAADVFSNKLFTADFGNSRTVGYLLNANGDLVTGQSADFVVGQPDLNSNTPVLSPAGERGPNDVKVCHNQLLVADAEFSRVDVYNLPTASAVGAGAEVVLGEPDGYHANWSQFFGYNCPADLVRAPDTMCAPLALDCDNQNVYVGDYLWDRVQVFPLPLTTGEMPSAVFGPINGVTGLAVKNRAWPD